MGANEEGDHEKTEDLNKEGKKSPFAAFV